MKEAIGGISIFQIVIVFILLFTGIMCLTINHSRAFAVKDEIINIIERENVSDGANLSSEILEEISEHMVEAGYRITGNCPDNWIGYTRDGDETNTDAAFCIKANLVSDAYLKDLQEKCNGGKCDITSGDYPTMIYYDVILFYQLDIPVIKHLMNFKVTGSTKLLFG